MTTENIKFDTLQDMAAYCRDTKAIDGAGSMSQDKPNNWNGGLSFDESNKVVIENGGYWADGCKAVEAAAIETGVLNKTSDVSNKRAIRSVVGQRPHVAAMLSGSPRAMVRRVPRPKIKPVVKIIAMVDGMASVTPAMFYNRGAAILGAVKALENQGFAVELTAAFITDSAKKTQVVTFGVKKANDRMGVADLAFTFCHAAMTRRYNFKLLECSQLMMDCTTNNSYGSCGKRPESMAADFDIVLTAPNSKHFNSPAQALENITDQVNQQLKKAA